MFLRWCYMLFLPPCNWWLYCRCEMRGKNPVLAIRWRGWRLRTMRRLRFFIHHIIHRFSQWMEHVDHVIRFSQSRVGSLVSLEALTPNAYVNVPKILSVIQPGRRWDSPVKLTFPIFLHTFTENDGIYQMESGSGGLSRRSWLSIICRRRRAWAHGKSAFGEADWKEKPWK